MRRLMTKFWKEIAYAVGFVLLTFSPFQGLFLGYGLAGTVWFVVWLLRNSDGTYDPEPDLIDSRGLHGEYSDYNHRH
ncbi:hypothetical protein [Leisingera sp. ANG-Vp]|uniref:hypothetical protein n=1 Tax=Leisingera sp. ANG-Vp TaxID=1577896 RepID=UPI00057D17E4|nr:hypothetical protein [Leisingera sp. ANG-Vp]KIC21348.1 hypothetical protein RA20_04945 [Leisingera sp. ANG-Vp]